MQSFNIFTIQQMLIDAFSSAIESYGVSDVSVNIERPKDSAHGDFSCPVAMLLAKKLKKQPLLIAGEIVKNLKLDTDFIMKVEVVPPGFINLKIHPLIFYQTLQRTLEENESYGKSAQGKGEKVILEFVSANPTGPLNIVSARAAALGESISNLLLASGTDITREYYVNDAGVQARLFGESLIAACDRINGKNTPAPEGGYQGAYMEDLAKDYVKVSPVPDAGEWGMNQVLQWQKKSLLRYDVHFDNWYSEKKLLHDAGLVQETIDQLKKMNLTYEKDGAIWIKVSEFGAPKDEVLVKSDGHSAYFAADIAYHIQKFKRGFNKIVDIWGPDHHGHIIRMKAALQAAGYPFEQFSVIIAQQVNLIEAGGKVKMSKREGKFVTLNELLDQVGKDAARFFFVMRSANTHLDFDIEVAKKQTEENPVFYIQYAHARICSLLKKCADNQLLPSKKAVDFEPLQDTESFLLLKEIMEYPQWVLESGKAFEPHRLVIYLQSLAANFHLFYAKQRILDAPPKVAQARLALALGVKTVLRNALGLLGVSAPDQM
ncbi:MAG TPA: arginine--tRNA ligase [bacterium]|nr:arginine--tRNA ligase [bacterium]